MAINCPGCGSENADGARFCRACGATIAQASAATVIQPSTQPPAPDPSMAPTTGMPAVTPPQAAYTPSPPPYTPPAQPYAPPAYQQPAYQQPYAPAYQQPAAYPAAYPAAARASSQRGGAFYVGAAIVLICGLLVLVSTFMAWFSVEGFGAASITGWETRDAIENGFFDVEDGKPLFSGYFSLILGGLTLLLGALLIATSSKGLAGLILVLFLVSLGIAAVNTYSILTIGDGVFGYTLGVGMYMFLAGSVGGLIGSIVSMAG